MRRQWIRSIVKHPHVEVSDTQIAPRLRVQLKLPPQRLLHRLVPDTPNAPRHRQPRSHRAPHIPRLDDKVAVVINLSERRPIVHGFAIEGMHDDTIVLQGVADEESCGGRQNVHLQCREQKTRLDRLGQDCASPRSTLGAYSCRFDELWWRPSILVVAPA